MSKHFDKENLLCQRHLIDETIFFRYDIDKEKVVK